MDYYRLAAIAIGVLVFSYPWMRSLLFKSPAAPMSSSEITQKDLESVLHMAHRLRKLGCQEGAVMCQKLLDIMLNHGVR